MSNTTPESPENEPVIVPPSSQDTAAQDAVPEPTAQDPATASEQADEETSALDGGPIEIDDVEETEADTDTDTEVPAEPLPASGHVSAGRTGTVAGSASEPDLPTIDAPTADVPVADAPGAGVPIADAATADVGAGAGVATTVQPVTSAYEAPQTAPAWAPEPGTAGYGAPAAPIYVTAPTPPKEKGNRGAGILIALLGAVAYAVIYAAIVFVFLAITRPADQVVTLFSEYLYSPSFYIPIIFFALAFIALVAIANRGGWWWYVFGAFIVAIVVYASYIGGALLTEAQQLSPNEVGRFVDQLWAYPLTIASAIAAREVPIWFGAWIAARGRKVRARNVEARQAYDRELSTGPQHGFQTAP